MAEIPYNKETHLLDLAGSIACAGVVVCLDVDIWDGCLQPRKEWGMNRIKILPETIGLSFSKVKADMLEHLENCSMLCHDGHFMPRRSFSLWLSQYRTKAKDFNTLRASLTGFIDEIRNSARISIAPIVKKTWADEHGGESAPPSHMVYATNLAVSLVPRQEDLFTLYSVGFRLNQHSFVFMGKECNDLVDSQDVKQASWKTVDELVAEKARNLSSGLRRVTNEIKHKAKRISISKEICRKFAITDLVPTLGLSTIVGQLLEMVEGKTTPEVDDFLLKSKCMEIILAADRLSSVSGILERTKS